jgi:hypothetical protein
MPSRGKLEPSFFEETVAGTAYLTMMGDNITPCIRILFSDEDCYFQHDLNNVREIYRCSFPWKMDEIKYGVST